MWEAPVKRQRTSIGLDVHARSVVGCGLDGETGQLFERRLTPDYGEVLEWIRSLPAPVTVTYEAGPTGFGLARFLEAAGIGCLVAAPSKLQRPVGDRVKTDARDAAHLARLRSSPGTWCARSSCDSSTSWFRRLVLPVWSPVLS
ncbi:MAG: transposase, partial [Mycobacterium sp.]